MHFLPNYNCSYQTELDEDDIVECLSHLIEKPKKIRLKHKTTKYFEGHYSDTGFKVKGVDDDVDSLAISADFIAETNGTRVNIRYRFANLVLGIIAFVFLVLIFLGFTLFMGTSEDPKINKFLVFVGMPGLLLYFLRTYNVEVKRAENEFIDTLHLDKI